MYLSEESLTFNLNVNVNLEAFLNCRVSTQDKCQVAIFQKMASKNEIRQKRSKLVLNHVS